MRNGTMFVLIILLSLYPQQIICVANLKYFETLSHVGVTSSIKRSSDGTRDLMKHVRFRAFDRDFDLTLKSGTHLMAEGFRARVIHEDRSSTYFDIDQSRIFSGHLTDRLDVRVHAHTEDTLWSIQIFDKDDIYAVEPAWRLLKQSENPKNDTMIAYRASDFSSDSFNSSKFCGVKDHEETGIPPSSIRQILHNSDNMQDSNSRGKRDLQNLVCVLYLVGDYTFYKGKCKSNHVICSTLMFDLVNTADMLYRRSVFEDSYMDRYTNIGLVIGEITVYSSYTLPLQNYKGEHFNERKTWTMGMKLDAFGFYASIMTGNRRYCLNHLFTDFPFPNRLLGLAWLSALCLDIRGGIGKQNAGVTSSTDNIRGPISLLQFNLVFAHELGHNFGSEHDPATSECSKPDNEGGNFLMWPYSVSGELSNHHKFSPCSLKHIGRKLTSAGCLISRELVVSFCGNGVVEKGEECDAGAFGVINTDPCCTNKCTLRPEAICSDRNQACCRKCTMAPAGTLCMSKDFTECKEASYCTGQTLECPEPLPAANWTTCRELGQCFLGKCRGFCEIKSIKEGISLKGCMCRTNENEDACKRCCFNISDSDNPGPCVVYSNEILPDGTPCYQGFCEAGICESNEVSTIRRLVKYLPPLNVSGVVKFMRDNIVLCVIVLTMFMWIPPVYFINKADNLWRYRMTMDILKKRLKMGIMKSSYQSLHTTPSRMATPNVENSGDLVQDSNSVNASIHSTDITSVRETPENLVQDSNSVNAAVHNIDIRSVRETPLRKTQAS